MAVTWKLTDQNNRPQKRAKDFVARMSRIPPKVKRRIYQANEKSAEELVAMMVRLAPRSKGGGDLERSITYYEITEAVGGGVTWRVVAGNEGAFYARFVEFGNGIVPPHPFFYASWRAMRRLIKRRQIAAWRKGIEESK
jgi:hypothetical protein